MRRAVAIGAVVAIALSQPALAWEHGFNDANGGQTHWVIQSESDGPARLAFFCTTIAPGSMLLEVDTGRPAISITRAAEISLEVDGAEIGPMEVQTREESGNLLFLTATPQQPAGDAARAVYAASGPFSLAYGDSVWTFTGADHVDSFGAMLDACG